VAQQRRAATVDKMTFPLDIGIDLDGCLYPFADVMRSWAAGSTGQPLPEPREWSFWRSEWGLSDDEFETLRLRGSALGVVYDAGVPDVEILSMMRRLADAGHRLHVISARAGRWHVDEEVTREWLWRWGVPHETLHVVDGSKAPVVAGLGVRVMLEDSIPAASELAGVCRVVMWAMPWNEGWAGDRIRDGWEFEAVVEAESDRIAPRGSWTLI
jgi:hypothetical protein